MENLVMEQVSNRGESKRPMMQFADIYRNRRVLVTGHTGFKGAWLCEWLLGLGATVAGYSLTPPTTPALFNELGLTRRLGHVIGDIRDLDCLLGVVTEFRPDFVFHMAAQSLVRKAYDAPVETYAVNIMGTVNLLEALRLSGQPCVAVLVTSDKCYENRECVYGYREDDPMGGFDPYSSSKGAAEIVIGGYRRSYFSGNDSVVRICSARSGNVIGGGDWAANRIVPDCIRSLSVNQPIRVRHRTAVRPWQHVLEPLSGYLWLGAATASKRVLDTSHWHEGHWSAFNFGPPSGANRTVEDLVEAVVRHWPGGTWEDNYNAKSSHEAHQLTLSAEKALRVLGWQAVWSFERAVAETVDWYHQWLADATRARALTVTQINAYVSSAEEAGSIWAKPVTAPLSAPH
jgi:CDP-glucose 4,6-dehydratase